MHRVPQAGLTKPAVAGQLERGVRHSRAGYVRTVTDETWPRWVVERWITRGEHNCGVSSRLHVCAHHLLFELVNVDLYDLPIFELCLGRNAPVLISFEFIQALPLGSQCV